MQCVRTAEDAGMNGDVEWLGSLLRFEKEAE